MLVHVTVYITVLLVDATSHVTGPANLPTPGDLLRLLHAEAVAEDGGVLCVDEGVAVAGGPGCGLKAVVVTAEDSRFCSTDASTEGLGDQKAVVVTA